MGWVNLVLIATTLTLSVDQLEKRDHDNRCYVGCRKESPHDSGWAIRVNKGWKCRCVTDYEEADLLEPTFNLKYKNTSDPTEIPWEDQM